MCDVLTPLPTFTANRTNRVPLEFREKDSGEPIDLTGKTLRISYWLSAKDQWQSENTDGVIYSDEVAGDSTGDVEFVHEVDAFDFAERAYLGWVLDVIEGGEVDPYAKGTVVCDPSPPSEGSA